LLLCDKVSSFSRRKIFLISNKVTIIIIVKRSCFPAISILVSGRGHKPTDRYSYTYIHIYCTRSFALRLPRAYYFHREERTRYLPVTISISIKKIKWKNLRMTTRVRQNQSGGKRLRGPSMCERERKKYKRTDRLRTDRQIDTLQEMCRRWKRESARNRSNVQFHSQIYRLSPLPPPSTTSEKLIPPLPSLECPRGFISPAECLCVCVCVCIVLRRAEGIIHHCPAISGSVEYVCVCVHVRARARKHRKCRRTSWNGAPYGPQ